jgi:hypothetical protein
MDAHEEIRYHRDQLALLETYGNINGQRAEQARAAVAAAEERLAEQIAETKPPRRRPARNEREV